MFFCQIKCFLAVLNYKFINNEKKYLSYDDLNKTERVAFNKKKFLKK